jgi:hypothetical protein
MMIMEGHMDQVIYQSPGTSSMLWSILTTTAPTPSARYLQSEHDNTCQPPSANGNIEYDWTGGPLVLIGPAWQKLLS